MCFPLHFLISFTIYMIESIKINIYIRGVYTESNARWLIIYLLTEAKRWVTHICTQNLWDQNTTIQNNLRCTQHICSTNPWKVCGAPSDPRPYGNFYLFCITESGIPKGTFQCIKEIKAVGAVRRMGNHWPARDVRLLWSGLLIQSFLVSFSSDGFSESVFQWRSVNICLLYTSRSMSTILRVFENMFLVIVYFVYL